MNITIAVAIYLGLGSALAQNNNQPSQPNDPLFPGQVETLRAIGAEGLVNLTVPKRSSFRIGDGMHEKNVSCAHPDIFPTLDLAFSKNFVGGDICDDWTGHGAAMAGLGAKCNNGLGLCGLGDGEKSFVLSTVRQDSQNIPPHPRGGDYVLDMFEYVEKSPFDLVLLSDSTGGFSTDSTGGFAQLRPTLERMKDKVLFIFAAGNEMPWWHQPDISRWDPKLAETQGCNNSDLENVLCPGGLELDGSIWSHSFYGPKVNLGLIAQNILTACPEHLCGSGFATPGYTRVSGTSPSAKLLRDALKKVIEIFLSEYPEARPTPALLKRAVLEGSCFEPKLLGSDPRKFGNPIRFCADGVLRWLRRYAEGKLEEAEADTALQVTGVNFRSDLETERWVEVYGSGFAEDSLAVPPQARISYSMGRGHVRAWCNGNEADVGYVSPSQVNLRLPVSCSQRPGGTNRLVVARTNKYGEVVSKNVVLAWEGSL